MWQKLYEALSRLVTMAVRVDRNEEEIKELRCEMRELAGLVHQPTLEMNWMTDQQQAERERMLNKTPLI